MPSEKAGILIDLESSSSSFVKSLRKAFSSFAFESFAGELDEAPPNGDADLDRLLLFLLFLLRERDLPRLGGLVDIL